MRCNMLAGCYQRMYVSFPFNVNEILRKRTVDIMWFKRHKDIIGEVYCAPFFMNISYNDMNGPKDTSKKIELLYNIRELGLGVCITFNDVFHQYQDDVFEEIYRYRDLITALVVPDESWIGILGPKISYRNTVVHNPTFDDVKDGLWDDYDIVYIHDEIIHNHDKWKAIKGSRKFGCVVNFPECVSYCNHKKEHYKAISEGRYMFDVDGAKGCPAQTLGDVLSYVRCAVPQDYIEYMYYSDVIDVFKLQGRTQDTIFKQAVDVVETLADKRTSNMPVLWKYKVRNCGGDCLTCRWCWRFA